MEFIVKKNQLQKELGFAQSILEKKLTIPVLHYVAIRSIDCDEIEIVATDLDVSIRCRCAAKVTKPGTMIIQGHKLNDVVRNLPEADVHFKKDGQDWAVLQCDRSRFRITGLPEDSFPSVPFSKAEAIPLLAEALRFFIGHTIFAIPQEESARYSLNCAQFAFSKGVCRMIATDGHRLALVESKDIANGLKADFKVLIPRKGLIELQRMLADAEEEIIFFSRDENNICFQVGARTLICRALTGQFPNYELVLLKEINHSIDLETERFMAAIKRVALMADERSRGIKLRISNNSIEITAQKSEVGEAHEIFPIEYSGTEINVGFNAQYMLDFLLTVRACEIHLEFKDQQSQALMRPKGDSPYDLRSVIMPMRI
jgi:DNA polymerase-3 subunit beta